MSHVDGSLNHLNPGRCCLPYEVIPRNIGYPPNSHAETKAPMWYSWEGGHLGDDNQVRRADTFQKDLGEHFCSSMKWGHMRR